jgi:hypothetical protein
MQRSGHFADFPGSMPLKNGFAQPVKLVIVSTLKQDKMLSALIINLRNPDTPD